LEIRQIEAARRLGVSKRTLSLWECDRVPPVWANQPRIVAYLRYDPFTDPTVGRPTGNETLGVAFLSQSGPLSLGQQIMKRRIEMRKNRKQCAQKMGISVKTLHGWETDRYQPSSALLKRLVSCLGLDCKSYPADAKCEV
jgi:DNA-binding XRE family transcriptional regulator